MASIGNEFIRKISLEQTNVRIFSEGNEIVWFDRDVFPIGVSPLSLTFDSFGFPRDQVLTIEYPTAIFTAFDLEDGITTPPGITATARHLGVSGGSAFIEVTVNAEPTGTTNTLLQNIIFTFQDMSTININTERGGQADLLRFVRETGSTTTSRLGGSGTLRLVSNPIGASYTITEETQGLGDDTGALTITPTTGTAGGSASGTGETTHTFTWTANTLTRQRSVLLRATNNNASDDSVVFGLLQGADTAIDTSFVVSDTTPYIGETVTLTADVLTGDPNYDYRIFSGDTTGTLTDTTAFTATADRVFTANNIAAANSEQTHTVTAADGENTYTLYVRETSTPNEVSTRTLTFHATAALAIQVPRTLVGGATRRTNSNVPWYFDTAELLFRAPGVPSGASLSASVTGTDALVGAVTLVGTIDGTTDSLWTTTVSWTSGNPSPTSTRTAAVTISYNGANMFGTLAVRQNSLNSQATNVEVTDAVGNTTIRDWDDLTSRTVGVSITNFPGSGSPIVYNINGSNVLTEYLLPVTATSGSGGTRTATATRISSLTDSIISEVGLSAGSSVVLQGSDGEYSQATVDSVNSGTIVFSGVRTIVSQSATLLFVSYGFTSQSNSLTQAAVSGVTLRRSGFSLQLTHSGSTTLGSGGATETAAAGYKAGLAFTSNNTATTPANVDTTYFAHYRGVDLYRQLSTTNPAVTISRLARPYVTQRLLNAAGTGFDADNNTTFDTTLAATAGASADIWIMHDVNQVFNNVTDGSLTDDDFLVLSGASVESANNVVVMPTSFINANSTVAAVNGDNLSTTTYARRSRIDIDSGAANTTTNTEVDNININFTDN